MFARDKLKQGSRQQIMLSFTIHTGLNKVYFTTIMYLL